MGQRCGRSHEYPQVLNLYTEPHVMLLLDQAVGEVMNIIKNLTYILSLCHAIVEPRCEKNINIIKCRTYILSPSHAIMGPSFGRSHEYH